MIKGGSGLDYAYLQISNGPGDALAVLRKKKGKWVGTAVFPKWAGTKKASVAFAAVSDVAGNSTMDGRVPGAKKLTKALKPGFKGVWTGTGTGTVDCYVPGGKYDVEIQSHDRVGNESVIRKGSVTFTE